jgi:hypothetical protein
MQRSEDLERVNQARQEKQDESYRVCNVLESVQDLAMPSEAIASHSAKREIVLLQELLYKI